MEIIKLPQFSDRKILEELKTQNGRHFACFPIKLNNQFLLIRRDSDGGECSLWRDSSTRKCLPYLDLLSLKNEGVISGQSSWAHFFRGMSLQHGSLY